MKGILPAYCRTMGYIIIVICIFVPFFMFIFRMIDDTNLMLVKASIKLLVWCALFMIFLARTKNENDHTNKIRVKSVWYALYFIFIYYIIMLIKGVYDGNLAEADNSILIVYMAFNVICLEFGIQKDRIDKIFKK